MKSTKINTYSFIDSVGTPITGYLKLYEAGGSTTPVTAYDIDGNVLPTPIRLNGCGSIDIYLADNVIADAHLYDEDDFLVKTIRSVGAESGGSGSGVTQAYVDSHDTLTLNTAKGYTDAQVATKQDTLTSGTNIKTINGESILGAGNISVGGSSYYISKRSSNSPDEHVVTQAELDQGYADIVINTNIDKYNCSMFVEVNNISAMSPGHLLVPGSNFCDHIVVTFYEDNTTDSDVGTITGTKGTLMKLYEDIYVQPLYYKFRVYFKSSHIVEAGYSIRLIRSILFIKS